MGTKSPQLPQTIRSALFKEHERFFLLQLEKDLVSYIRQIVSAGKGDGAADSYIIQAGMLKNSYYRLLSHHLCQYYHLKHANNSLNQIVVTPSNDDNYRAILDDLKAQRPTKVMKLETFCRRNKKVQTREVDGRDADKASQAGSPSEPATPSKPKVVVKKRQKSLDKRNEKRNSSKGAKKKIGVQENASSTNEEPKRAATSESTTHPPLETHHSAVRAKTPQHEDSRTSLTQESHGRDPDMQKGGRYSKYSTASIASMNSPQSHEQASPMDRDHTMHLDDHTDASPFSPEESMDDIVDQSGPSPLYFNESQDYAFNSYSQAPAMPMAMHMPMPYSQNALPPHLMPPPAGFYPSTPPHFVPQMMPYPVNFYPPGVVAPQQPYINYAYPYDKEMERKLLNNPYIILPDSQFTKKHRKPNKHYRSNPSSAQSHPNNSQSET